MKNTGKKISTIANVLYILQLVFTLFFFGIILFLLSIYKNYIDNTMFFVALVVCAILCFIAIFSFYSLYLIANGYGEIVDCSERLTDFLMENKENKKTGISFKEEKKKQEEPEVNKEIPFESF